MAGAVEEELPLRHARCDALGAENAETKEPDVRTLALLVGLVMLVIGVLGFIVPGATLLLAHDAATPIGLYVAGIVRVAIGLVLLAVAPVSRFPVAMRVLGGFIFLAGLVTPLVGVARARTMVDWWAAQGPAIMRLWSLVAVALGVFVALASMDRHGAAVRRARRAT